MALFNTYVEMGIKQAPKQRPILDLILDESPILGALPTMEASTATQNVFQTVKSVVGGDLRALDAPSTNTSAETALERVDLSVIDGVIEVGADTVDLLGMDIAFGQKEPLIIKKTMMNTEYSLYYDNLLASALASGNYQLAGGSSNTNYSMVAVHYEVGENIGLISPNGVFGKGTMFDFKSIHNGSEYKNENGIWVYGKKFKTLFGMQTNNPQRISAIVNIDIVNGNIPTIKHLANMLLNCEAGQNTVIYCHPAVLTAIGYTHKMNFMNLFAESSAISTQVEAFNKTPFVTSYNLKNGTEANVA